MSIIRYVFVLSVTLKFRVEWYKSLCAYTCHPDSIPGFETPNPAAIHPLAKHNPRKSKSGFRVLVRVDGRGGLRVWGLGFRVKSAGLGFRCYGVPAPERQALLQVRRHHVHHPSIYLQPQIIACKAFMAGTRAMPHAFR